MNCSASQGHADSVWHGLSNCIVPIMPTPFHITLQVRDYELDMQGVVNNSVYQNYLEHARHLFLKARGVDFAEVTRQGVNLVVTRIEMDFLASLTSGDEFAVSVEARQVSRVRWGFTQEITRVGDGKTILRAQVIGTALDARGRPHMAEVLKPLLED
jgi:acyl-CoA thioester hydrolase